MEGILPPSQLNLRASDLSTEWRRWSRAFSDYLLAINLIAETEAAEKRKLALFRHIGGEDVRELYGQIEFFGEDGTTELNEGTDGRKLEDVLARFKEYCNPRSSVIVSRFEFHNCSQQGESVDVFLMKLRRLAEGCDFGNQRDSLIRDKLLFGLDDTNLRGKLMRESDKTLTLEYVIKAVRVNEVSKVEKTLANTDIHSVRAERQYSERNDRKLSSFDKGRCTKCGRTHALNKCPAYGTTCKKCGRRNHWAAVCRSQSKQVDELHDDTGSVDSASEVYLGEISEVGRHQTSTTGSWVTDVRVDIGNLGTQYVRFKLDTGAALSVCGPQHVRGRLCKTDRRLFGPGRTPLKCLGVISSRLTAGKESLVEDLYIVDKQKTPLLSKGACEGLGLLSVDHSRCEIGSVEIDSKLFQGLGRLDREYSITLKQDAKPFAIHVPRPVAFPLRAKAEKALQKMIDDRVIVPVEEPTEWVAPMVVVPKPGQDSVRICTDYTALNKHILREIHPMSTVESSLAAIGKGTIFSKIDANSGFWQIPLSTISSKLTTFLSHKGRFRYLRLPQGLNSSPEIFQAEMNRILAGIDGVIIHMDDVLVVGEDKAQHDDRLQQVLSRVLEAGMTLNESKCKFGVTQVQFLGHIIDQEGIHAGPRVQGILDFPTPVKVFNVRSFLGLVNQFARFTKELADVTKPLRDLLRSDTEWYWGNSQQEAFNQVKEMFRSPPVLATYDSTLQTFVTTDASNYGLGATLSQVQGDGTRRLVAAASRSLTETEQRYAAIEKESLGICWAMEKFSQYVLGMRNVVIETDHKPLTTLFGDKFLDRLPPRIQGFKLRMQRFGYEIRHISGKLNIAADALSRHPSSKPAVLDLDRIEEIEFHGSEVIHLNGLDSRLEAMKLDQRNDEALSKVIEYVKNGWPSYLSSTDTLLQPYFNQRALLTINKGFLMLGTRLVIPLAQRMQVLQDLHRGHLGITKCQTRARSSVWWPAMSSAIETMVRQCRVCQVESNKPAEPLRPTATPERPWQMLGSDLFHYKGQMYLLLIDYYSRYPEIALLGSDSSSRNVVMHLKSMFSRHGIPDCLISDNGPQYSASEFSKFAQEYGFTHVTSSPRFPQANGAAERAVQTIKQMLKKESDPYLAMLAYRSSPQHGQYSPAELLMGRKLKTTMLTHPDSLQPALPNHDAFKTSNDAYKIRMKENHDNNKKIQPLQPIETGTRVYIRDNRKEGVAINTSDSNSRQVIIETNTGNTLVRNRAATIPIPDTAVESSVKTRSGRVSKLPKYLEDYKCS